MTEKGGRVAYGLILNLLRHRSLMAKSAVLDIGAKRLIIPGEGALSTSQTWHRRLASKCFRWDAGRLGMSGALDQHNLMLGSIAKA